MADGEKTLAAKVTKDAQRRQMICSHSSFVVGVCMNPPCVKWAGCSWWFDCQSSTGSFFSKDKGLYL